MSGHIHAELMAKAAEIAKNDKHWYRHFQVLSVDADQWFGFSGEFEFDPKREYRLKPITISINGYEVPAPLRADVEPAVGDRLYVADTSAAEARLTTWNGAPADYRCLSYGILHCTKEAADCHRTAMLSFSNGFGHA
ncbi:hypothetical protein [Morganella phage Mecenats66]|nr:hypothetical protein [Morganella phage Mecenats66]